MKKPLRIVLKVVIVLLVLCLLGIVAVEVFPPAPYEHVRKETTDDPAMGVGEKTGWYIFDDGGYRLLTWSAKGGLTMNRFDSIGQSRLRPKSKDVYVWDRRSGDCDVTFERNAAGEVSAFQWTEPDGRSRRADKKSDHLYRQQEVQFFNDTLLLSGVLFQPLTDQKHPAVLFIHGSGESDRDAFWYLYQAHTLASGGIAVLLPDKRGCGKSLGTWHTAGFDELAKDALAGIQFLSRVDGIDTSRLGVIGFSQGGWIAPLVAQQFPSVKFVVSVSGAAVTPARQLAHEVKQDMINSGVPEPLASVLHPLFARRAKKRFPEFWEKNGDFNPLLLVNQLQIPTLYIYGENDEEDNVPVQECVSLLEELKSDTGRHLEITVYPNSGHALGDPATGWIRQEYLDNLGRWIIDK